MNAREDAPLPPPSPLPLGRERFPEAPPGVAVKLALGLRSALLRLADAITPAELVLLERSVGLGHTYALAALAKYGVVDQLGGAVLTADELASRTGLDADALYRTLRALAATGVFSMRPGGRFANNRVSRALGEGRLSRSREWFLYWTSGSNARAWANYEHALRTGTSPFDASHGMNVWQWFDAHPDEREMFAHCMMGITALSAPVVAKLYPFVELKTLCDVGGGRGTLLSELLLRHAHLRGTLAEGEGVLASARELLEARGVSDRVTLVKSNFFEDVPSGADGYVLKNILHDWDDPTCAKILSVTRGAMATGAKLLVCESLVEREARDRMGPTADLQMMVACSGGRERGLGEFHALFAKSGFRPGRVFEHPIVSVIEGVAA